MKVKYQKPALLEDTLMAEDAIMISASAGGSSIIEDGGTTSENSITTGDSRKTIWDDDEF